VIDNKINKFFPPGVVYIGYALLLFSLPVLISDILIGILLILFGSLLSFTFNGLQIDKVKNEYKEYTNCLGIYLGKWKSLEKYSCLVILTRILGYKTFSRGQVEVNTSDRYFEIYLMSENHRLRLLIGRFQKEENAIKKINDLERKLNFNLEIYCPS